MNAENTDQKLAKMHEEASLIQKNIKKIRDRRKSSKAEEIKALINKSRNKTWEGYLDEENFESEIDKINKSQDPLKTLAQIISERVTKITAEKTLEYAKEQAFKVSQNLKDMKKTSTMVTAPASKQKSIQSR